MKFVHLHNHTDVSSDGLGTVENLVKTAKDIGFTSLAITDHGSLGNAISFWSSCKNNEIKPIFGYEAYFLYLGKRYHLTLLAENKNGFENLLNINNASHRNFVSGYPLTTLDILEQYKQNIICLTGCPASAIYEYGTTFVYDIYSILGKENVFVELMFVDDDSYKKPFEVAQKMKLDYVITNDSHFACSNHVKSHQVMTKVRKGYTYNDDQLWLKTPEEIYVYGMKYLDEKIILNGMDKTIEIAERVETWDFADKPTLPYIEGSKTIIINKIQNAFTEDTKERIEEDVLVRKERIEHELKIVEERNLIDYFYILLDIINYAKDNNIMVGIGRGSGAGSYLLYLLGITGIDPIENGLFFERFLNPERSDYPDVDCDFETEGRDKILEYAKNKWGAFPIATWSRYSHKSLIHDKARILNIPYDIETPAADYGDNSPEFQKFCDYNPVAKITYDAMIGQIRHRGKHAAGIIITNKKVPLENNNGDLIAVWTEGENRELSKVGIVKYDLLGITGLSQLKMMIELSGVAPPNKPGNDPKILDLFRTGNVNGIFQWSGSEGIRQLTIDIKPKTFEDLVVINALYRPGALGSGALEYPKYIKKPRKLEPRLDEILKNTNGVICFQEQMMQIFAEVVGCSFGAADIARRVIVKSKHPKENEVKTLEVRFKENGIKRNFDQKLLDQLWDEIIGFSRYGFVKAHSACYTFLAYQMAFYKVYYPGVFYTAMLAFDEANRQTYIIEAIENGIRIEMPEINTSGLRHNYKDGKIYLPLSDIKFFGENNLIKLLEIRKEGEFTSYEDVAKRIPKRILNKRVKELMERIGVFRNLAGEPTDLIEDYYEIEVKTILTDQMECLGYVIPDKKILRLIKNAKQNGYIVGFITEKTDKVSNYGAYRSFRLSPNGSFWLRENYDKLTEGDFVCVKVNKFNKATEVHLWNSKL